MTTIEIVPLEKDVLIFLGDDQGTVYSVRTLFVWWMKYFYIDWFCIVSNIEYKSNS